MDIYQIGISYEGDKDIDAIRVILYKIFNLNQLTVEITKELPVHTGIIGKVAVQTNLLFKQTDPVSIAIFLTDQDKSEENRERKVTDKIKSVDPELVKYCAIGIPDPHFEKWLMVDKDHVKKLFKISSRTLPFSNKKPKQQLELLQRNMDTPVISLTQCYIRLAEEFNVELVRRACPDFDKFYKNILAVIENLK